MRKLLYLFSSLIVIAIVIIAIVRRQVPATAGNRNLEIENITGKNKPDLTGYKIFQTVKLNCSQGDTCGSVLVLIDRRLQGIKGEMRYDSVAHVLSPVFSSDEALWGDSQQDFKPAMLLTVNESAAVMHTEILEKETARLDSLLLNENKPRSAYLLTIDYSAGMGSYNGPISYLVDISRTGERYMMNKKGFMSSLKSAWVVAYSNGKGRILYKTCRPDWEDTTATGDKFFTYYDTYSLKEDNEWLLTSNKKEEFWENEDGDDMHSFLSSFDSK